MTEENTPHVTEPEGGDQRMIFDFNLPDNIEDTETRALIEAMSKEIKTLRERDDQRAKEEEELKRKEYEFERKKLHAELEAINSDVAKEYKDSHKNEIEQALKTAKLMTSKFQSFGNGASIQKQEKKVLSGYDRVNKEKVYT